MYESAWKIVSSSFGRFFRPVVDTLYRAGDPLVASATSAPTDPRHERCILKSHIVVLQVYYKNNVQPSNDDLMIYFLSNVTYNFFYKIQVQNITNGYSETASTHFISNNFIIITIIISIIIIKKTKNKKL